MPKAVWGVDVSKFSIKAARLVPLREGAAEISHLDVIEYPIGQEGADEDMLIKDALVSLMKRNRLKGETICVSLPGHTTFNRFIKIPPTDPKKVAQLVKFEAQQHIPFPMDQVVWGYQMVEKEYGPGDELELVLFAVKKDIIYHFLGLLQAVDFPCDILQFSPVALYNFLMHDQDVGTNCFILDIGADNSDLIVIDGEKFWIRNIPITGNSITKALQQKFQIPLAEAEKLKVNASSSPQAQKIFGVVQPVLRDLVGEIHRSIGYYKSLSKTVRFEKMMIVGNASKTINFQRFMSQNLQIEAMKLAKLNKFSVSNAVPEANFQDYLPTLGVACGLGLQGMGVARNKINLLPEEEIQKREVAKKKPIYAAAVAGLLLTVGLMYWNAGASVEKWKAAESEAAQVVNRWQGLKSAYESAQQANATNKVEPERFRNLMARRDGSIALMNALSAVLPDNEAEGIKDAEEVWILAVETTDDMKRLNVAIPGDTAAAAANSSVVQEENELWATVEGGIPAQADAMTALDKVNSKVVKPMVEILKNTYKVTVGEPLVEIVDSQKPSDLLIRKNDEGGGMSEFAGKFRASQFGGRKFHRFKFTLLISPSKAPPAPVAPADGTTPN